MSEKDAIALAQQAGITFDDWGVAYNVSVKKIQKFADLLLKTRDQPCPQCKTKKN